MKTKSAPFLVAILALFLFMIPPPTSLAQAPGILNYQGRVAVNGTNYDGTGLFKFSLVNGSGTVTFWSNGTSTLSIPVTKGLYSVLLGDTSLPNMDTIPATVFTNSDVRLRVWFNSGSGMQLLTPDQRIAAAGYALQAAGVQSSEDIGGRRLNIGLNHNLGGTCSSIAGGSGNSTESPYASVGGGATNSIRSTCSYCSIGGGNLNSIQVSADYAAIVGGLHNTITNHASRSFIGCGDENIIEHASHSIIGSGAGNMIQWGADLSVIGGGFMNSMTNSGYSVLIGGNLNNIQTHSSYAMLGGGSCNSIQSDSFWCTLGGGYSNSIGVDAQASFLGGGSKNSIATQAGESTLSGGGGNSIQEYAYSSMLGGGFQNAIQSYSSASTLGGGYQNTIQNAANYSTLGGGRENNILTNAVYSTLGGGSQNTAGGQYSTLGGGSLNSIPSNAVYATLGGGASNLASGPGSFVGGGGYDGTTFNANTASGGGAVTVGGTQNIASGSRSTVAGGHNNSATSFYATVPGGAWNLAAGAGSFAAGRAAKAMHDGAFVWCDETGGGDLVSTNANSVSMRARGGYRLYSSTSGNGVFLASGGGSWTTMSDRNMKEQIATINSRAILEKVAGLSVATWQYKGQDVTVRHIGPMAQDFKAAFGVGESETGITTVDADGVALAAIKGLYEIVKEKDTRIAALERELRDRSEKQDREMSDLRKQVQHLMDKSQNHTW